MKNQKFKKISIMTQFIVLKFDLFQSTTIITNYLLSFINISTVNLADKSLTMLTPDETLIANDFATVLTFVKGVLNLSAGIANWWWFQNLF